MKPTRRDFLRGAGALVVAFSAAPLLDLGASAQGPFDTHASHIDPTKLDSWLAVDSNGIVTAYTGKCEFGQGMLTAQTQLVAEELCVPLSRVKLIACDTSITPDQGTTSGSQSSPTNFNTENLALAAATARETLIAMAAERLGQPASSLTAANGEISAPNGKRVTYQELVGARHFDVALNKTAHRRSPSEWTVLGKPIPALDRPDLVTAKFEFVHNHQVPGMLHARVVRPPGMGATLLNVDESSVSNIPGIVKVVVRKNLVAVVAETQYAAVRAAQQLAVKWQPGPALPAQDTFFDHLRTLPSRDDLSVDSGDVEAQLKDGTLVRATYRYPYQMHGSMGASCAVADVRADQATVWSPTQSVYPTRSCLAMLLNLPAESIRVIFTRGSGCYGLNGADAVSFDAAMISQAVGKPVRLQYSRHDESAWENLGAACVMDQRGSVKDGRILAWDRENWDAALGNRPGYQRPGNVISGYLAGFPPEAFSPTTAKQPEGTLRNGSNAVPSYVTGCIGDSCNGTGTVRSERVLTHTVPSPLFTGPLRAPLRIQNTFANECFMDELCEAAGADPVQFRLDHLQHPRLIAVLKAAAKAADWKPSPLSRARSFVEPLATGRGVACANPDGNNGYVALIAEVEVNTQTGAVHPTRFVIAQDCGPVSNPDGLRNQAEGGLLQGMSRTLSEEVTWDDQHITSVDWKTYKSLHLDYPIPTIECVFVQPPNVRATGAGEMGITVTPAALGNAISNAIGARVRQVPFTPERVLAAIHERAAQTQPRSA